jgi:hypothetical protein
MNPRLKASLAIGVLRWTARILGTIVLVLVVLIAIGEGVPNPLRLSLREQLLGLSLALMLLGLGVAWKWEGVGGALILGGFACFAAVNHGIKMNAVFAPLLTSGVLYLLCWWLTRRKPLECPPVADADDRTGRTGA